MPCYCRLLVGNASDWTSAQPNQRSGFAEGTFDCYGSYKEREVAKHFSEEFTTPTVAVNASSTILMNTQVIVQEDDDLVIDPRMGVAHLVTGSAKQSNTVSTHRPMTHQDEVYRQGMADYIALTALLGQRDQEGRQLQLGIQEENFVAEKENNVNDDDGVLAPKSDNDEFELAEEGVPSQETAHVIPGRGLRSSSETAADPPPDDVEAPPPRVPPDPGGPIANSNLYNGDSTTSNVDPNYELLRRYPAWVPTKLDKRIFGVTTQLWQYSVTERLPVKYKLPFPTNNIL